MDSVPNSATPPRPASAQAAVAAAEHYGRYQLVERIGQGGMAEVFRAVTEGAEGFRRVFVIKRIRPEKSDSPEFIQMFCDEARICALLNHPSIVQVYDFGQINGSYFMAMEYLRGKDLSSVMRALRAAHAAVPPALAAFVAQQAALGLHHAHIAVLPGGQPVKIVHRDVTPSNIMLLRAGGVKILDFGIAKAAASARQADTGGGRVKGKLAYLSPEQVRGMELDGRSDVFALGVVLWEMLTGQRLFTAENEFQTMRNVLMRPVPVPSSLRTGVPPALDAIVARALERDRERRYQTAQALADDIERFLRDTPCSIQAVPRLLQDLFGDEPVRAFSDVPPARRSDLAPPAGDDGGDILEVSMLTVAATGTAVTAPSRPADRGRSLRRMLTAVAAATMIACLGWAGKTATRAQRRRPAAAAALAAKLVVPAQAAPPAEAPPAPPADQPPPRADAQPAAYREAPARRSHARRARQADGVASGNVTIDPFK